MKKNKLVLIAGPTGVGKTATSVLLAKKMNTRIISCDSMQIYRGMDIGTAKVTEGEKQGVVHYMIDVADPEETFSVCDYVAMAQKAAEEITGMGMIPIVAGGTGLYADSLIKGISFDNGASADEDYRREMESLCARRGKEHLHSLLMEVDRESGEKIHPNNTKRVIRALEYYHTTGERISDYNKRTELTESPYDSVRFYLTRDRAVLYDRIDKRVDIMMEEGLVREAELLLGKGSKTALQALGYKELLEYFEGRCTLEEATALIKQRSRQYAKRQLTWFSRDREGIWINADEFSCPEEIADRCHTIVKERFNR